MLALTLTLNPLWGHCQEYKIEKNAILQEHLLSEKRNTFVCYNLTLSERICFADHENKSKSSWHTESLPKIVSKRSHQEECIQSAKTARCVAPCVPSQVLQITDELPSFPQQGRVLSDWRIDFQTTLSSRSQLESSADKPVTSRSTIQTPRQELRTTSPHSAGMKGSATSEDQKDNFFCRRKVFSKREHDRLSLSAACIRKMATLQ